jgi:GNAT superfamily N-acetyltransferase
MTRVAAGPAFSIRETSAEDLEEILLHRRMMFNDMGYRDESALDRMIKSSRPYIKRYLDDKTYRGWFAVAGDRIAAGAGVLITDLVSGPLSPEQTRRPYVLNVYTYPEYRKLGLARKLMQTAIEWCRSEGFKILWLHASDYGRPMYESLGFVPTNEMKLIL